MHMLRNAVSHGIEAEAERTEPRKPLRQIDLWASTCAATASDPVRMMGEGSFWRGCPEIAIRKGLHRPSDLASRAPAD